MKTTISILLIAISTVVYSQEKASVAVANPYVQGLSITPDVAAKYIQLELIKLDKFSVYDEFDMAEVIKDSAEYSQNCFGISCLVSMGEALSVENIIFGSFDGLGNKIAISIKWVDVNNGKLHKSVVREFDNQEHEVQRMVGLLLREMLDLPIDKELADRLKFNNELVTTDNIGRINNSGPRIGYAYLVGSMNEFARRSSDQGGLDIFPGVSMIGYQIEGQYVGTENFSALVEGIINFSGMEQGVFIPSLTVLNGFRFGKSGWEVAFGPGFSLKRESNGFFDKDGEFNRGSNYYYSEADWMEYSYAEYSTDPQYQDAFGNFTYPSAEEVTGNTSYANKKTYDARGNYKLSTTWVFAFGRTFRAGALNIPINVFYSSSRGGGMAGLSVGFNVQKKKSNINPQK